VCCAHKQTQSAAKAACTAMCRWQIAAAWPCKHGNRNCEFQLSRRGGCNDRSAAPIKPPKLD
jgi:hypothetical protein